MKRQGAAAVSMDLGLSSLAGPMLSDPARVKHYEILSRLGEGGMGVVYRARDTRLGRTVALKMLHGELARDEERTRRFEREARIVSSLSHPGIATIYDFDQDGDSSYFAMELVEGSTLRQLLADGPMEVDPMLDCGLQVAEALAAAHREGVIHRDLKPENIMLAESGFYKVLDFGVARFDEVSHKRGVSNTRAETMTWATRVGGILGTVAYMSPEQAMAEPVDARSDIFSFGSLMYELLTGQPAFQGKNEIATADAIAHGQPQSLRELRPGLPVGLERVIGKCLAKKTADRYQTAADLAGDLRLLKLESLTGSRKSGQLLANRSAVIRRRKILAGTVGALALVALAVVVGLGRSGSRPAVRIETPRAPATPAGEVTPAALRGSRPRVVVSFFENQSGVAEADWLSRALPEMLTTDLSRSKDLEVIATQRLYDLMSAAGYDPESPLDGASATELARWAGATVVISGSVFKLGDTYRIDAQAYDIASGTAAVAHKVEGADLFALVTDLTSGLRQGLKLATVEDEQRIASTSSEEAFRHYTFGREQYDNLNYDRASADLERAIEIDPEFGLARLQLALNQQALGHERAAVELVEGLLPDADRLPERERLLTRAFDAFFIKGDAERGAGYVNELLEQYPDDGSAYVMWARALAEREGNRVAAMRKLRAAVVADANNLPAIAALADQLARLGDPATAETIVREAATRNPQAAASLDRLLEKFAVDPDPS